MRRLKLVFGLRSFAQRQEGFTLMEALLAVLLFMLVAASSIGIFSQGLGIWKRSQGISRLEKKAILALEKMAQDIQNTLRLKETKAQLGEREPEIGGNRKGFKLPSRVSFQSRKGGTVKQIGTVFYEWKSPSKTLCRGQESATDLFLERNPECLTLATSIESFQCRYYLYTGLGNSYSWYDEFTYDAEEGLPLAVEIKLTVSDKSKGGRPAEKKTFERLILLPVGGKPTSIP